MRVLKTAVLVSVLLLAPVMVWAGESKAPSTQPKCPYLKAHPDAIQAKAGCAAKAADSQPAKEGCCKAAAKCKCGKECKCAEGDMTNCKCGDNCKCGKAATSQSADAGCCKNKKPAAETGSSAAR